MFVLGADELVLARRLLGFARMSFAKTISLVAAGMFAAFAGSAMAAFV